MRSVVAVGLAGLLVLSVAGCAAKLAYTPPGNPPAPVGEKVVLLPFDQAWEKVIANAGRTFFVINNIEKASGFVNLSYSGNPEEFVNCGYFDLQSKNIEGQKSERYSVARERQVIHQRTGINVDTYYRNEASLEGRANLILQKVGLAETKMLVSVRYVVRRKLKQLSGASPLPPDRDSSASFNSGQVGYLSDDSGVQSFSCVSTGRFENTLLRLLD